MYLQLPSIRRYTTAVSEQQAGVGVADPSVADPGMADSGAARAVRVPEGGSPGRPPAASHTAVTAALERDLGERHGLGVSEFEVLERLAEDAEHKFRVQELAESVHLSQSALSRMIAKLEQHGLVQRSLCDLDRRGIYVCLTDAGRHRHAEALPTHRAVLSAVLDSGRLGGPVT